MDSNLVARSAIVIDAPPSRVWEALVDPDALREYMFGAEVRSDWRKGSRITWKGDWKGKPYEDKGEILEVEPPRRLRYTHSSHHTVSFDLSADGERTRVALSQDGNADEEARRHSEQNWDTMLAGLKRYVESSAA